MTTGLKFGTQEDGWSLGRKTQALSKVAEGQGAGRVTAMPIRLDLESALVQTLGKWSPVRPPPPTYRVSF